MGVASGTDMARGELRTRWRGAKDLRKALAAVSRRLSEELLSAIAVTVIAAGIASCRKWGSALRTASGDRAREVDHSLWRVQSLRNVDGRG